MPISEIEEILSKYKIEEDKIEILLKTKTEKIQEKTQENAAIEKQPLLTLEAAKERNQALLKELEIVKGNLRAKSIFSPTEMQWEKISKRYQDEPSLPVTSWRCHLSVFV